VNQFQAHRVQQPRCTSAQSITADRMVLHRACICAGTLSITGSSTLRRETTTERSYANCRTSAELSDRNIADMLACWSPSTLTSSHISAVIPCRIPKPSPPRLFPDDRCFCDDHHSAFGFCMKNLLVSPIGILGKRLSSHK
jgi:hypothetical protein